MREDVRYAILEKEWVDGLNTISMTDGTHIYQLHIALEYIQPVVWRRIWIPSNTSLIRLNRIIQISMGWTGKHGHEFEFDGRCFGIERQSRYGGECLINERRQTIGLLLGRGVSHFHYRYSLTDGWLHTCAVEKIMNISSENSWAQCLDGENACPPPGVGNIHGYMEFIEAITDQSHPNHTSMRRWYGGPFDSRGFDINSVNRELRRLSL